jgi:peptidase M49-like protein
MRLIVLSTVVLAAAACARAPQGEPPAAGGAPAPTAAAASQPIAADVEARLAKLARTELKADLSALSTADQTILEHLIAAAREMDPIFDRQAWEGNPKLWEEMQSWTGPQAEAARALFQVHKGPWDRLDELKPFVGTKAHPDGAGFYPEDMTKQEFDDWITKHPDQKDAFISGFTVIRREAGGLVAVPYSKAYAEWLGRAAQHLGSAAGLTGNTSLETYLETRAKAFLSDDYYESDMAWMDLDAPVEVTIGPYENYEDGLYGYKTAFEAFVTVALPKESEALALYKERLPWLERNLPIPDKDKNLKRGTASPIRVVDTVFASGDGRRGVMTVAFNLPNDERVREAKGSKKVLLRNVMRAKYDQILVPIAQRVLAPADVGRVSFDAFFNEVLHHELGHGLGPGTITKDGKKTEVRLELKELFNTLEEAKADVMGVYNILALIEKGDMAKELRDSLEPTYVAGLFRSARFGLHEAHGKGVVAQFTYLLEKGALQIDAEGRFQAVSEKFPGAIKDLLHDMLVLQAKGDYDGTKAFLDKYGQATPQLEAAIAKLGDVVVDINPVYTQAGEKL